MIDIVFSDSACGSLKAAQHFGKGKYQSGAMAIIGSHDDGSKLTKEEVENALREVGEKARLAWESATPMCGKTADIYGFNLMLSVGDISENQPGIKRKLTLAHLYSIYPNEEGCHLAEEILKIANENLQTIHERTVAGEALRIWYSNQPDEMCGLYWFLHQLNQWNVDDVKVSIVKLPEWETNEKGNIMRKNSWAEVAPEEWLHFLALKKTVSLLFIQNCATYWQKLQEESAPIRAVINGQLVSASEKLYDDFILREISEAGDEFHEARIIGRVLGKYQLGIGDSWVALRIEEMINDGKFEAVNACDKDMPIYHRVLKKCKSRDAKGTL
jgi:hypothetical protein